jgi:hypothetical protein
MLRTIAISLIFLLSVGVMLPFANSAHGVRQSTQVGMRRHHRYHSRAWWRRYRARLRKKRAAAALAHRNAMLGQPQNIPVGELSLDLRPTVPALPATTITPSEVRPSISTSPEKLPGQMNVSIVALSRPNPVFLTAREESKMLGGTTVSDLRRIVIDKMMVAGGWVINDFVREINGARVFVVTARTPRDTRSPEKMWTFYFTEADGRIYGLTTEASVDSADRMSTEAERFINKLQSTSQPNNR